MGRAVRTRIKICGITRAEDLALAREAGADLVGLIVDVARSPRSLTLESAAGLAAASPLPVVVLVARPALETVAEVLRATGAWAIQLVGEEDAEEVRAVAGVLARAAALASGDRTRLIAAIGLEPEGVATKGGSARDSGRSPAALADAGADAVVIDTLVRDFDGATAGGTGMLVDLDRARGLVGASPVPAWLAGGLAPGNVEEAVRSVGPHGVDVSSGVEIAPGVKDPGAVRAFVAAVRRADGLTVS